MKTSIKLVLIYFLMQLAGALTIYPLCIAYFYFVEGRLMGEIAPSVVPLPLLLGFLYMGIYLWKENYLTGNARLYSPVSFSCIAWSLAAGASSFYLIDTLMSQLSFLPDWLDDTFELMQTGWVGILCLSVLGPVLEELLFRGAITKVLLERYTPGKAILISGLIFGIFHLNPAQVVGACLYGFLFAWLYYKSGSLVPGILLHILNNSLSVWFSLNYEKTDTMADILGTPAYWAGLVVAVLLLVLSLKKLNNMTMIQTTEQ